MKLSQKSAKYGKKSKVCQADQPSSSTEYNVVQEFRDEYTSDTGSDDNDQSENFVCQSGTRTRSHKRLIKVGLNLSVPPNVLDTPEMASVAVIYFKSQWKNG